jgi:hypothetical protein
LIEINAPPARLEDGPGGRQGGRRLVLDFIRRMDGRMELMGRMARRAGAPLPDALADGRLSPEELRAAAQRCTACTNAGPCAEWLDTPSTADGAVPSYCRNRHLFARLTGRI